MAEEGGTIAQFFAKLGLHVDEKSFEKGDKALESLKHGLEILGVFEAVKTLRDWVSETQEAAIASEHMAQRLGITTEEVQKLGYAADVSGVSHEQLNGALMRLSRNLDQAATKGGPAAAAMKKIGVSMSDPVMKTGTLSQKLQRLSDGFADAGDKINKNAVATAIGGRQFAALIPLLNKGGDGIRELGVEFEDSGAMIDEATTKAFEGLEESQKRVGASLKGIRNQAVIALLPEIQKLTDQFQKWVKTNRALIVQKLEWVFHALASAVKGVGTVLGVVTDAIGWMTDHWGILKGVLVVVIGTFVALQAQAVVTALAAAAAGLLALAPFILWGIILGALYLVIEDLWVGLHGGNSVIMNLGHSFVEWAKTSDSALADMVRFVQNFIDKLKEAWAWITKTKNHMDRTYSQSGRDRDRAFGMSNDDGQQLDALDNANGVKRGEDDPAFNARKDAEASAIAERQRNVAQRMNETARNQAMAHNSVDMMFGGGAHQLPVPAMIAAAPSAMGAAMGAVNQQASAAVKVEQIIINTQPGADAKAIGAHVADALGTVAKNIGAVTQPGGKVRK